MLLLQFHPRPIPSMREVAPVKYLSTTSLFKPKYFKYLCTLVGLQGGNAHFGKYFQQTIINCFDIIFLQLIF